MSFSLRGGTFLGAAAVALLVTLMGAPEASAAPVTHTFTFPSQDTMWCPVDWMDCDEVVVTVTFDKDLYAPGETIKLSGKMSLFNRRTTYGTSPKTTDFIDIFLGYSDWQLIQHRWALVGTVNGITQNFFDVPIGGGSPPMCKITYKTCPAEKIDLTFTAPSIAGTYSASITATLDQGYFTQTLRATRTVSLPFTVGSAAAQYPDLIASKINETTAVAGTPKVFSFRISNVGNAPTTNASFFNLLQRADTYNAATDTATNIQDLRGTLSSASPKSYVGQLAVGASGTLNFNVYTFLAGDAGMKRYLRACTDKSTATAAGAVTEGVAGSPAESNNCGGWTEIDVGAAPTPDLRGETTTVTPSAQTTGVGASFSAQVKNHGNATISNVPTVFLVQNAAGSVHRRVPGPTISLDANATTQVTSTELFSTSTPGTYYVSVAPNMNTAGTMPVVTEPVTGNNLGPQTAVAVTTPPPLPDLTAGAVTPTQVLVNTSVKFSATVTNGGASETGSGFYTLFQRADNAAGDVGVQDLMPGTRATSLGAGLSAPVTMGLGHTFTAAGTYWVRACADKSTAADEGLIPEVSDGPNGNNCGAWTEVRVDTIKPDLTAGTVYWTGGDATVNVARNYSAQISNAIAPTGVSFYNKIQVASGANGTGTITNYTTAQMAALSAGGSGVATRSHQFTSVGTYSMRACADENAAGTKWVVEADENNNCSSSWVNVRACTANAGSPCQSAPNECNEVAQGVYQCDGTCSAIASACSVVPEVTLLATPARVPKCSNTTLTWTTKYAPNSCTITRQPATTTWPVNPQTVLGVSGSTLIDAVCENTKYEITCVNAAGPSLPDSVIVNILPDFTEF